ncbi:MAG: ABC transporter permease [Planctomycetes bacterium]|nr:ABC transporter permease [Planctomycetota bacterium]
MLALVGIILNTFREVVRRPFYWLLLAAGAAALLVTMRLPLFTFYSDVDMYKDLGLSFVLLFVLLVGLLAAATGVAREVEDKTAHTILAKAVGRWQFILGKYLGAMGAVAAAAAVLGLVFAAAVYYRVELDAGLSEHGHAYARGGIGLEAAALRARQWNQALTVVPGLVLVLLQVGVLAALATAVSARLSPAASVGLSLVAFVAGHLTVFLESAARGAGGAAEWLAQAVMALVPFLEIFNINQKLSHAMLIPLDGSGPWGEVWAYVGWAALYAVAYAGAAIGAGVLLFRRRPLS